MIITISGTPGSGKSTVGRLLAKRLGYHFYSMGDVRGKMATDRGMTIDELNELGKTEDWTDRDVDEYQTKLGAIEDNFVIDSWAGFHFIPHAFKVFLAVDPVIAGERVFKNQRPDEPPVTSPTEAAAMLTKRLAETDARFQKYYDFSCQDRSRFDLVIDTTTQSPEETIKTILASLPENKKTRQ